MARTNTATRSNANTAEVRAWAMKQAEFKKLIGTRGRIPSQVREAYNAAHPDKVYVSDATSPSVDVEGLIDQAETFLKNSVTAGVALLKVEELIVIMNDPDQDFFYPNVARKLRATIDEAMTGDVKS